ncbi:hypothetical protein Desku_1091 [Desulfofundulus kuznetsovii DSM 6115]|uniref:Uncharacterized protein n=1 Tax=Desulfofundulus kuznetsovii (strain DSM 6115 / VKM B-1805 / 17) TaxID=760568 RepID=A0AAU8PXN4_DESK7|nr:hypothetical protein Desku_1091 [Desulfofundulus kuznetsovii DSM 6115]
MKQGSVGVELLFTIKDESGQPVDLTTALEARLIMSLNGVRVERLCSFADRAGGVVKYVATGEDFASPGVLLMELEVRFADGRVLVSELIKDKVEGRL